MGTRYGDEKWGRAPFGASGGTVTWSLTAFTDRFSRFDGRIEDPDLAALARRAVDAWEDVLDIRFVELDPFRPADIEIGWSRIDGRGGVLGVAATEFAGDRLLRAAVRMDPAERWSADPDLRSRFLGDPENFYAVLTHEIGHAIGLAHLSDRAALMHPTSSRATDLTLADVRAGVALYGPNPGSGGPGAQIMAGTGRDDRLSGGGGADALHGFAGADTLEGGAGRDRLFGAAGPDRLEGGPGQDRLHGGGRADRLAGGAGRDRLDGGRGDDRLHGGAGPDRLKGEGGDDRLDGGAARDRLIGGPGEDVFVLGRGRGRDIVKDFAPGEDRVEIASGAGRFEALEIEDRGRGAAVAVETGLLILKGVEADALSPDDFLFA